MTHKELEIDFAQLSMLSEDDPEFMIEILELIQDQSPGVLTEMKTQLQSGSYLALSATAHKYKSSINILGNSVIDNLVNSIEKNAKTEEKWEELDDLVQEFESVCDRLLEAVKVELEELKG
ncbi:MAG: Hpt domain-containing protein [Bacteroidia bacterium]|nr:Hpt domain-containing protein [Bacteroidia bacterium]